MKNIQWFRVFVVMLLVASTAELGGIWRELIEIQRGQVKNYVYARPEMASRIQKGPNGQNRVRMLEGQSTADIQGTVEVEAFTPLPVQIEP